MTNSSNFPFFLEMTFQRSFKQSKNSSICHHQNMSIFSLISCNFSMFECWWDFLQPLSKNCCLYTFSCIFFHFSYNLSRLRVQKWSHLRSIYGKKISFFFFLRDIRKKNNKTRYACQKKNTIGRIISGIKLEKKINKIHETPYVYVYLILIWNFF